ncbi:PREDICTED: lysine histidine transporter 1-like [Papilio polytes]|uniref:Vesicular inhibitory amino acid transporter n=1 Tax=Papilio polytes TaxID=76194 RepID=I4DM23_PAPPL|nr:lysine histidine transporter 1-like [Papilio polytes]BAM18963.1 vesicular inhibitory amino acid transporter [Papilio polytes]
MSKKSNLEAAMSSSTSKASESTPLITKTNDNGEEIQKGGKGLSVNQAALLVAGEMAGSGVLALPRALVKTGWIGVPIIILMAAMAAFSGRRLGDCWSIIEGRDPEMRSRKRNPYAIIADQALGKTWSAAVSLAIIVSLFGAAVVYLLLAAQIIEALVLPLVPTVTFCIWYMIVAGAMTPLMLFATPKDFSFMGVIAFISTIVACVLYFIQMMNDIKPFVFRWGIHGFQDFFLAFGTIMFAFGGASTFPTIQNDMIDKSKFGKSVHYSFIAILALYLPIAIGGYAVYGESVAPNITGSLTATPLTLVGNIFMAVHLLSAFIIIINPVCQEMEELYNIPRDSLGYRTLVRVSIMAAIMFIGESVPRFYTILALVGGTTVALLTFILPPYCYLNLTSQPPRQGEVTSEAPGWMKLICWEIIVMGVVGGAAATFSAVSAIFSTAQATPCYLK